MMLKNYNIKTNEQHPFHLVRPSPWPLTVSASLLWVVLGFVKYLHNIGYCGLFYFHWGLFLLIFSLYGWFRDIVYEGTFEGHHTRKVQSGLRMGMMLFIVSEVMFFFSFFFAFFHASLSPAVGIGCVWPPAGIETLNPWALPLLNTVILLSSGVSITWSHRAIISGNRQDSAHSLAITILLGILFTYFQKVEYASATFSITDGIYGSIFYMLTGFHGFHVIMGTVLLFVSLVRMMKYHFTVKTHFGFEAAAWYWHFVDVVWLFLFITLYWWGS